MDENGKVVLKDGKPVMITIGTLYVESTVGRVQEILDEHGDAFVASLLDQQILHHQASAAFKAKASKTDSKVGLEKLKTMPHSANQLYKSTKVEAEKEGFDVNGLPDDAEVVMVNWGFKPGVSQAAVAKEEAIVKAVAMQIELLASTGNEITSEVRAKVEAFVRSRM